MNENIKHVYHSKFYYTSICCLQSGIINQFDNLFLIDQFAK